MEVKQIAPGEEKDVVDEIVTSWMRQGIKQGREEGLEQGQRNLLIRQIAHRFGSLEPELEARVNALSSSQVADLSIALLDFTDKANFVEWLKSHEVAGS